MPIIRLDRIWWTPFPEIACANPYPGHPKGCPNLGHKNGCPPNTYLLTEFIVPPYYAIINEFNLAGHVDRMTRSHPGWSQRQLECCLYWQPTARKKLLALVNGFLFSPEGSNMIAEFCPEAHGINVTETLKEVGVILEWPPQNIVRQVAIAGVRAEYILKEMGNDRAGT